MKTKNRISIFNFCLINMFGLIAAIAVVPNVDASMVITGDVQQVVEEQVQQEELQEELTGEVQNEGSGEVLKDVVEEILVHNGYSYGAKMQDYVNYAYHLGGIEFVKLIECENGRWDPKRVSKTNDRGLCQLNYKFNKKFINSPDFADPYKQLDYCYEKYKINPNLRYGPKRKIEGKKCSDYVSNRFGILVSYNNN